MKVGLDASVLVASVKRTGEKYHEDALTLAKKMGTGEHEGVCSALLLIEITGALASSTTMPVEKVQPTFIIWPQRPVKGATFSLPPMKSTC
ncbi:MAG: hypothetical protein HYW93_04280 [Thaumarchaeota archaeon]|nr:hypothetical protein [Nitrososphaerota archaeon]